MSAPASAYSCRLGIPSHIARRSGVAAFGQYFVTPFLSRPEGTIQSLMGLAIAFLIWLNGLPMSRRFLTSLSLVPMLCLIGQSRSANLPGPSTVFQDSPSTARGLSVPSKEITVRLYIDATSSMQGFMAHPDGGFPEQIQKLEQAAHLVRSNLKGIECFKFGTKPVLLPGPPCYANLMRPKLFALPRDQDFTKIEAVLTTMRGRAVTIIVTDLFEDQADMGVLLQNFKEHVFQSGLALGIVAQRAGFDGTIYDIGLEQGRRSWTKQRPYYALFIGQAGDIAEYFGALRSEGIPADHLLIFSGALLEKPISWATSKLVRSHNIAVDPSFIQVDPANSSFGVLRLQSDSECELDLQPLIRPTPFHPQIDWGRVEAAAQVRRFPRNSSAAEHVTGDAVTSTLTFPQGEQKEIELFLTWTPKKIRPSGRVYVEQVLLRLGPEGTNFNNTTFVKDWSTTPEPGKAANFDGSKTQYLSELLTGLWNSVFQGQEMDLGSVYVYFQR
jgi:hypothetical protein